MRYAPGTTTTGLTATISEADGDLVTPVAIVVDIYDPDGLKVDDGVPTLVSTGLYKFDYAIPADAKKGLWRIDWIVQVTPTLRSVGQEYFEVYDASDPAPDTPEAQFNALFRSRLGETKTDPMGSGSETFFSDTMVTMIYAMSGGDLNKATVEGWRWKMAHYSHLVDITESGSTRNMRQKFLNAQQMLRFWQGVVGDDETSVAAAMAGRIVGRAVNLRETCRNDLPYNPYPFSGYAEHVRLFPSHRLLIPAILGG